VRLPPRVQGDLGEASALAWLVGQGACVSIPFNSSPDYDLVADFGDERGLVRVQVKTSRFFRADRWSVAICTRGGNQSWSGMVKRFDASRCDALFVLVGDGRRWWLPAGVVEAATSIALGGPKYAAFEIERGVAITG
jgi:hypothetical protein